MQSAVVMDSIVVQVATHVTCPPERVSKKVETVDTSFQAKSQLSELACLSPMSSISSTESSRALEP